MLIDWHTHLSDYKNIHYAIDIINQHNIVTIACSMDIESYKETLVCSKNNNLIIPTFGIHPAKSNLVTQLDSLDELLETSKIIGEIGLDNFWVKDIPQKIQENVFEYILHHCNHERKFCVIHTKGAEKRVLEILQNFPDCKPIIHWYNGPKDIFDQCIKRRYYLTFGLELHYSQYIKELLKQTPLELILSETDNPESENWLGGNSDSPLLITRVVQDIARVMNKTPEEIENEIWLNSLKILQESGINAEKYKTEGLQCTSKSL